MLSADLSDQVVDESSHYTGREIGKCGILGGMDMTCLPDDARKEGQISVYKVRSNVRWDQSDVG